MNMIHVLLVEDDDLFASMVQRALAAFGYTVVRARNGREALDIYDPRIVGLVLTDVLMPGIEGIELIMALRKLDPKVKLIAMSGGGRNRPEAYLAITERMGVAKTLAKPFPLEDLQRAVKECIGTP
jgi:DNA-binding NtrC family response regulator